MSNEKISLLSQIHGRELVWNANVLVSRIWHYRGATDDGPIVHTGIVVLDQKGTHMYGQIPLDPAERLKDILEEGKVYLIRRFMCKQSKQTYRAVESPYMMQFTRFSTAVPQPGDAEDYPYCTYNLLSFLNIPVPGPHTARFLDVIGRITAVTDILVVHSQYQPEPSDTRTIVLQDQSGNEIRLVLWGARAREFEAEEVRFASESGPVIAIFVGTLPKMYRGVKALSGSSACRWYINEDLPEMNAFHASLPEGLGLVTAHIPGEQAMVPTPVREPPVEMSVQELLALDPFINLKKQFMVKVVITHLGSDNRWWFLSCRECHKTSYTAGRQYRCSDNTCPCIEADPSYCLCTFGSDGATEAEFMFFDRAAKSIVGKPLMTLIHRKYPAFTSALNLPQIGGSDVGLPVEICRLVTQKYRLVVSISNKSFQPTSTQLSFQVSRIDEAFKPELAPLGFGGASRSSGASSSAEGSGTAVPIPSSFPAGSSTLEVLPLDEMNTPISALKGKRQAIMPKTPSKSPCPTSARRKLFAESSKSKDVELSASAANVTTQTEGVDPPETVKVPAQAEEVPPAGNVVEAAFVPNVGQETNATAEEDPKNVLPDHTKPKRENATGKGAGALKKARQ